MGRMLARLELAVGAQGLDRRRRSRRGWAGLGFQQQCMRVRTSPGEEGGGDEGQRTKGHDIPRTTSRTEVGSAKASRMNSCGIFGSATFSILTIQSYHWGGSSCVGQQGGDKAARLTD